MAATTSFRVRPTLAAEYATASAGCPLARRARVTSVPDSWHIQTRSFYSFIEFPVLLPITAYAGQ